MLLGLDAARLICRGPEATSSKDPVIPSRRAVSLAVRPSLIPLIGIRGIMSIETLCSIQSNLNGLNETILKLENGHS